MLINTVTFEFPKNNSYNIVIINLPFRQKLRFVGMTCQNAQVLNGRAGTQTPDQPASKPNSSHFSHFRFLADPTESPPLMQFFSSLPGPGCKQFLPSSPAST